MKRHLCFEASAWADYLYWQKTDKAILRRINELVAEILRHPFEGTGKPEALRFDLSGYWSRRITHEHRLVYKATAQEVIIVQCRLHY
jgi:toxin YoeB